MEKIHDANFKAEVRKQQKKIDKKLHFRKIFKKEFFLAFNSRNGEDFTKLVPKTKSRNGGDHEF